MKYNFTILNKARALPLRASEKSILLCLAFHADDDGICFPSYLRIKREAGVGGSTIKKAILLFEKLGIVKIKHRGGIATGKESNLYSLVFTLLYGIKLTKRAGGEYRLSKKDSESFKALAIPIRNEIDKAPKVPDRTRGGSPR